MFTLHFRVSTAATLISVTTAACATAPVLSPFMQSQLQLVSAGHTGCLPSENEISNSTVNKSGVGTWNATCQGRVFLCAAVSSGPEVIEYSCAPLALVPRSQ